MPSPLGALVAPYRGLDRRVWWLAMTRGINTLGFSIVMPLMGLYLVKQRDLPATVNGVIYLCAGLAAAVSQGLSGELADRWGRRRTMVTALCLRAANMIVIGLAVRGQASVHVLGGLIVLNGILRSMFEPAAAAAVTDLVPAGQRVAAFGLQRTALNLAWSLGPALGGLFAAKSYGLLFFFSAPVLLVAALLASRLGDVPRAPAPEGRAPRSLTDLGAAFRDNRPFFECMVLVFLGAMLANQFFSTLTLYMGAELGFPEHTLTLVFTINGILVVLLQGPAVAVIGARGPAATVIFGPALYAVCYLAIGLGGSFWWIALCVAVLTFGEVVFAPSLSDLAVQLGDPARHGRSFGLFGLMQTLGISFGPMLGAAVFDRWRDDHVVMWGVLAGLMALVALGWWAFGRRHRARLSPA